MEVRWLSTVARWLVALALGLLVLTTWLWTQQRRDLVVGAVPEHKLELAKGSFVQNEAAYGAVGEPLLSLKSSTPMLEVPDFRPILLYYGTNGRPDAEAEGSRLHFGLKADSTMKSVRSGERLFIALDASQVPPQYIFSPENRETAVWMEATAEGKEAVVKARIKNETGQIIDTPAAHALFRLKERESIRLRGSPWELGPWKVDATLLARQQARWYGPDLFLQRHGGDTYTELAKKQRIDFGADNEIYSVFVAEGDCLIWKEGRWHEAKAGPETRSLPLLVANKINERVMSFDLWDSDGQRKLSLHLLKATDVWMPRDIHRDFHFVGARTRQQTIMRIRGERLILRPEDWLLLTEEGWKKLTTPQEVDDYVLRKTPGILFIFNGLEKKGEQRVITGLLYNVSRSQVEEVNEPVAPENNAQLKGNAPQLCSNGRSERDRGEQEEEAEEGVPPPGYLENRAGGPPPTSD